MACTVTTSAALLAATPAVKRTQRSRRSAAATWQQHQQRRRHCKVFAVAEPEPKSGSVQDFARSAERVLARYDFLSAGMGALVVTGFCVGRGQDVGTALWITAAATVVALLVNDLLPEEP
ncbi:hypothetical protein ABPG77_000489 [Micractinium sp. CCAP 211/92]